MELKQESTIILYLLIFLLSTLFAGKSQKNNYSLANSENENVSIQTFRMPFFILSFIVFWIFIFFSDNGPDYNNYALIISRINWTNYASFYDQEPLFNAILIVIKSICNDSIPLTIAIVKTITLIIVYISFYIRRYRTNIGFSVMCYALWCYLESYYLLPMILAASIIMLACAIMREYGKKIIPLLLVTIAAQIHNSAYMSIIIILASFFIGNVSRFSKLKRIGLSIGYILVVVFASSIFHYASVLISNFHYGNYFGGVTINSGFLWLLMYSPLLYLCIRFFNIGNDDKLNNLIFLYVITSAMFKALSYSFSVIGRMEFFLIPLYSNFISEFLFKNLKLGVGKRRTNSLELFILSYVFFRGYLYFTFELEWMGNYHFINPFI